LNQYFLPKCSKYFCNTISTKQTYRHVRYLSAFGGKADNTIKRSSALWLLRERPMPSHKFHIGESVMLRAAVSRNVPGGVYEVTKQLPHNGLEFEYRIKSANEPYERIAGESELVKP